MRKNSFSPLQMKNYLLNKLGYAGETGCEFSTFTPDNRTFSGGTDLVTVSTAASSSIHS